MFLRGLCSYLIAGIMLVWASTNPTRADDPALRIAVLKFGTVNWLMETVTARGLDQAEGFRLETLPLASGAATAIAFQSGDADMLVSDWVWVMRQRADGKDVRFAPYLNALGALIAGPDVADLCDMKGRKVGVVGGADDKSWLVLQALADRDCGFDLAAETEALYGAPPLMSRQLVDGNVAAVSTFWHFTAKLEAEGMTPVIRVKDALATLGIDPAPALIGYVWDQNKVDPEIVSAFLRAVAKAGEVLAADDSAWDDLRPLMRAKTDAEFTGLRDAFRAGIPQPWSEADTASARKLYDLLSRRAGDAFTEQAGPFDAAAFTAP